MKNLMNFKSIVEKKHVIFILNLYMSYHNIQKCNLYFHSHGNQKKSLLQFPWLVSP